MKRGKKDVEGQVDAEVKLKKETEITLDRKFSESETSEAEKNTSNSK